jgi:hypothetical protein
MTYSEPDSRSPERRARDEQIAAEPPLGPLDLPSDAASLPIEARLPPRLDEIGYWSEIKLDIVSEYAQAYSTVLAKQQVIKKYLYIDAFAGAGVHISKQTGEYIL